MGRKRSAVKCPEPVRQSPRGPIRVKVKFNKRTSSAEGNKRKRSALQAFDNHSDFASSFDFLDFSSSLGTRDTPDAEESSVGIEVDGYCWLCHTKGSDTECSLCPRGYHIQCLTPSNCFSNDGVCPECRLETIDGTELHPDLTQDKLMQMLAIVLMRITEKWPIFSAWSCSEKQNRKLVCVRDLSVIKDRLHMDNVMYPTTASFLSDIKWISHNCHIVYGPKTQMALKSISLIKDCKDQLIELEACFQCFEKSLSYDADFFAQLCGNELHKLVWVKLRGFPYWPAKVLKVFDSRGYVSFFGSHDKSLISLDDCYQLSEKSPNDKEPKREGYRYAVQEMMQHIKHIVNAHGTFQYAEPHTKFNSHKSGSAEKKSPKRAISASRAQGSKRKRGRSRGKKSEGKVDDSEDTVRVENSEASKRVGDSEATERVDDSGATQRADDSGATPATERVDNFGATLATRIADDSGATPATQRADDSGATPAAQRADDSGATQGADDSGATERVDDSGSTERVDDSGSTERVDDSGSTERVDDSGSTERAEDHEAIEDAEEVQLMVIKKRPRKDGGTDDGSRTSQSSAPGRNEQLPKPNSKDSDGAGPDEHESDAAVAPELREYGCDAMEGHHVHDDSTVPLEMDFCVDPVENGTEPLQEYQAACSDVAKQSTYANPSVAPEISASVEDVVDHVCSASRDQQPSDDPPENPADVPVPNQQPPEPPAVASTSGTSRDYSVFTIPRNLQGSDSEVRPVALALSKFKYVEKIQAAAEAVMSDMWNDMVNVPVSERVRKLHKENDDLRKQVSDLRREKILILNNAESVTVNLQQMLYVRMNNTFPQSKETTEEAKVFSEKEVEDAKAVEQEKVATLEKELDTLKADTEAEKLKWEEKLQVELKASSEKVKSEFECRAAMQVKAAVEEAKHQWEKEKEIAVQETKKRQWCAYCLKEAKFHCCWNTSYCDDQCQHSHWSKHMDECERNKEMADFKALGHVKGLGIRGERRETSNGIYVLPAHLASGQTASPCSSIMSSVAAYNCTSANRSLHYFPNPPPPPPPPSRPVKPKKVPRCVSLSPKLRNKPQMQLSGLMAPMMPMDIPLPQSEDLARTLFHRPSVSTIVRNESEFVRREN